MEGLSPWVIFFASIFTGNILLTYFLGMCSFLAVSKQVKTALGLGVAVTFVMAITSALNYVVYYFILEPLGVEYLLYIAFIVVIAASVQLLEMIIERFKANTLSQPGNFPAIDHCELRHFRSGAVHDHSEI